MPAHSKRLEHHLNKATEILFLTIIYLLKDIHTMYT